MKKIIKNSIALGMAVLMTLTTWMPAYAGQQLQSAREIRDIQRFTSEDQASTVAMPRGRLISTVIVRITDEGNGTAGVSADIMCHEPMKKILMWLYLEQWDAESEDWIIMDTKEFSWKIEELAEGEELSMASVSYNVPNQERGKDYRVRGMFGAYDLDSSLQEVWQSDSGDILLE